MSNTRVSVSPHFQHFEVCPKYSSARRVFNSLLGVCKCGQTLSFVFDILLQICLLTHSFLDDFASKRVMTRREINNFVNEKVTVQNAVLSLY